MPKFTKPQHHKIKVIVVLFFIVLVGAFFRLYHINFGLPHSFRADEPEIGEFAINYTYEIRSIIKNTDYYKLIPQSYVYGQFPVYFFTIALMLFSKLSNTVGYAFDKTSLYIFMRSFNVLLSLALIPVTAYIYKKVFSGFGKSTFGILLTALLVALNWKLIVHAHYLNMDIILTILLMFSYLAFILYMEKEADTKYTVLTGVFLGLAIGTKVTAAITLPLYLIIFLMNKDYRNMFAFLFVIFGTFIISNPFSYVFANDFAYRVYLLSVKENGLVFDSVDFGVFKYLYALTYMISPVALILFLYGAFVSLEEKILKKENILLLGTVAIYILFYSLGTRRVDRWLLPIIPIVLLYVSLGMVDLKKKLRPVLFYAIAIFIGVIYLYYPILLLKQYSRHTPKSAAYLWMRDNVSDFSTKLVITQEGLDPMNKLDFSDVKQVNVYESEGGQFFMPGDTALYDYVVLSSRPLSNYKREEVRDKYPFFYDEWYEFESTVLDPTKFTLVKSYTLPKPNLLELSDVYVYESVVPVMRDKLTKDYSR